MTGEAKLRFTGRLIFGGAWLSDAEAGSLDISMLMVGLFSG